MGESEGYEQIGAAAFEDIAQTEGLEKALLDVGIIQPVGPMGCLRTNYLRDTLDRYLVLDG